MRMVKLFIRRVLAIVVANISVFFVIGALLYAVVWL